MIDERLIEMMNFNRLDTFKSQRTGQRCSEHELESIISTFLHLVWTWFRPTTKKSSRKKSTRLITASDVFHYNANSSRTFEVALLCQVARAIRELSVIQQTPVCRPCGRQDSPFLFLLSLSLLFSPFSCCIYLVVYHRFLSLHESRTFLSLCLSLMVLCNLICSKIILLGSPG